MYVPIASAYIPQSLWYIPQILHQEGCKYYFALPSAGLMTLNSGYIQSNRYRAHHSMGVSYTGLTVENPKLIHCHESCFKQAQDLRDIPHPDQCHVHAGTGI